MSWWGALRTRALAHADVIAATVPYSDARTVFWETRPQGSPMPALVFNIIADSRAQHLKGFDGMRATMVQADAYAPTFVAARRLADAAIAALVPHGTFSGIKFGRAMVSGPINLGSGGADRVAEQAGETLSRQMVELTIWHEGD